MIKTEPRKVFDIRHKKKAKYLYIKYTMNINITFITGNQFHMDNPMEDEITTVLDIRHFNETKIRAKSFNNNFYSIGLTNNELFGKYSDGLVDREEKTIDIKEMKLLDGDLNVITSWRKEVM